MKQTGRLFQTLNYNDKQKLLGYLMGFITAGRKERLLRSIRERTRYLTVVLEDIYQPHNASAVLRTCDCFGLQDVHIIENRNKYQVNPDVELGSAQWLNLCRYAEKEFNTIACLQALKDQGYRVISTSLHSEDFTPENLPLDKKTAVVFGTELRGLSQEALQMSDLSVRIPMFGFTESLNISVSAAILIYTLIKRIRESVTGWELSDNEKTDILLQWVSASVKKPEILILDYLNKNK